jgi:Lar family restriction alleviation protein
MEVVLMDELKPCPFCGGTDIRYSLKITGHFDVRYHAAMYCNKCHCYGARTLTGTVRHDNYKGRTAIENDAAIKAEAIEAWNRRVESVLQD